MITALHVPREISRLSKITSIISVLVHDNALETVITFTKLNNLQKRIIHFCPKLAGSIKNLW